MTNEENDEAPAAFIVTWNAALWFWEHRDDEIAATESGTSVTSTWRVGNRKGGISAGDTILLLRQGQAGRGLIGLGAAVGEGGVYEDEHWDPVQADAGAVATYIDVEWEVLLDDADRVPVEDLLTNHREINWNAIRQSGFPIPAPTAAALCEIIRESRSNGGEDAAARRAVQSAAGRSRGGQGFGLSQPQKNAVEEHAMKLASDHLRADGWSQIEDTSSGNPYDYFCSRPDGSELYVEVKGTTSAGESVVLTRREVEHHRECYPDNALIIVDSIELLGPDRLSPRGGNLNMFAPWEIEESALTVIGYTYSTKSL